MNDDDKAETLRKRSRVFAGCTVVLSLALFVGLLLSVALLPEWLAQDAFGGLNRGHMLVLVLHIPPVIAAWLYIYFAPAPNS
jgi:uncharacterized membrane protein (DUF485 family)